MNIEDIKKLNAEGVEKRTEEIRSEMNQEGADIAALTAETDALIARRDELRASAKAFEDLRTKIGTAPVVDNAPKETKKTMKTIDEVRSTPEYMSAFAGYIRTGKDDEVRSILTEQAGADSTAKIPVPTSVDTTIKTAWDNMQILSRVTRTNLKGVVKVGVETSGDEAVIHQEGTDAPAEEKLTLKIVTMNPETIKKWMTFSDEALDLDDGAFVDYVYKELTYRIMHKLEDVVVDDIVTDKDNLTDSVAPAGAVTDFINAAAKLSDEAVNPVIIMNKQSEAYYKGLAIAANYAVDPFDGMTVLYNNTLKAITSTSPAAGTYAIVGDLTGEQVNFPNGDAVQIKYDDLSLAEKDLVKVVGRIPASHGVASYKKFVTLKVNG